MEKIPRKSSIKDEKYENAKKMARKAIFESVRQNTVNSNNINTVKNNAMPSKTIKKSLSKSNNISKNKKTKKTNKMQKLSSINKNSKLVFENKFYVILVVAFVAILLVISLSIVLSSIKEKPVFNDNMDTTHMNISKNAENIKAQYQKDDQKQKFLDEYDKIQSAVGTYAIGNTTMDKNSFKDIIKKLNNILAKDDWKDLDIENPSYWAGKWSVDDSAKLKFKFSQKNIEPSWINDDDISGKIIKN